MKATQITHAGDGKAIYVEYSSMCPWNCDGSKLLLVAFDHFALCDGDGAFIHGLTVPADAEPRWSRTKPNTFYFLGLGSQGKRNTLLAMDVTQGRPATVKEFLEYERVSGRGESDISPDGDHFALCGTRPNGVDEVFVYSMSGGKGKTFLQLEKFDGLKITANNHALLSKDSGIWDLETGRNVTPVNGHACPAVYQSRSKLIWCSNADPKNWRNAAVMVDVATGEQVDLIDFKQKNYAIHISCCDQHECLVSAFDPSLNLPAQAWKVPFDGSAPTLRHEWRMPAYRDERSAPKASLSRDGSRFIYNVDTGHEVNAWLFTGDAPVKQPDATITETRIDYSSYVGKSEFVLRPRPDGAVDIIERKLK